MMILHTVRNRGFMLAMVVVLLVTMVSFYPTEKVHAANVVNVSTTAELATAVASAVSGDTIVLADGTYTDSSYIHITNKHGTALEPITIKALNQGKAVISGELWFLIEDSSYIVLDGLKFTTNGSVGNKAVHLLNTFHCQVTNSHFALNESVEATNAVAWVLIEGENSGYNRVDHSLFENKLQLGQFVSIKAAVVPSVYNRIDHNRFRDMRIIEENGAECVKIGNGSNDNWSYLHTVLEYNLFERCDGEQAEFVSIKSGGNIIRHNVFVETAGSVVFRRGNGNELYGNYFFGNNKVNAGGVRIHGEDHRVYNNYFEKLTGIASRAAIVIGTGTTTGSYNPVKNVVIANNTLVENRRGIHVSLDGTGSNRILPEDTVIANNLVYASGSSKQLVGEVIDSPGVLWEGNMMYAADSAILGKPRTPEEILVADPLLVVGNDQLYRLDANSPAIDAATLSYPEIDEDIEGYSRDAEPDIGAFEYRSSGPSDIPPVVSDIDPVIIGVGDSVWAKSSEAGALHLLPKSDYFNRIIWQTAKGTGWGTVGHITAAAAAHTLTELDTEGFPAGDYKLYAIDAADRVSVGQNVHILDEVDFLSVVDDTDPAVTYSGTWDIQSNSQYFLGSQVRSGEANAYIDIPFYGKQAKLYGSLGTSNGKAEIYLDNVYQATFDFYSPTTQVQQEVFNTGLLPEGEHVIRLKVLRQRTSPSTGYYVPFDALKVLREDQLSPGLYDVTTGTVTAGDPVEATSTKAGYIYLVPDDTAPNKADIEAAGIGTNGRVTVVSAEVSGSLDTTSLATGLYRVYAIDGDGVVSNGSAIIRIHAANEIDDTDARVSYGGTWTHMEGATYFLSSMKRTGVDNAYVDITFNGSGVKLFGSMANSYGKAKIYVDGLYQTTVDNYRTSTLHQQEFFDTGVLTPGEHTVRIEVIRERTSPSVGYYISFDYAVITP